MTQSWTASLGWFLQRLPLIGLLAYTILQWKYLLLAVLVSYSSYILLKNIYAIFTDTAKLPKSSLKLLIFLDIWISLAKFSSFLAIDISYTRAVIDRLMSLHKPCPSTLVRVEQVNEDTEVYVYSPAKVSNRGCIVYIHGGGWSFLSACCFSPSISWMCHYLEMVVVSVEYRLAPEHPFPAGLIDCYNALQWIYRKKEELDVDEDKIFVAGDSAGGNLSAAMCLLHRDRKGTPLDCDDDGPVHPPLAGQLLLYPVLQAFNHKTGSMVGNSCYFPHPTSLQKCISSYVTGREDDLVKYVGNPAVLDKIPKFWGVVEKVDCIGEGELLEECSSLERCTGDTYHAAFGNSYIFPLHSTDLTNLPAAYVLVATADTLMDEGEWYAKYLEHHKNTVVLRVARNCHGFMGMYDKNVEAREELMKIKTFVYEIINKN